MSALQQSVRVRCAALNKYSSIVPVLQPPAAAARMIPYSGIQLNVHQIPNGHCEGPTHIRHIRKLNPPRGVLLL